MLYNKTIPEAEAFIASRKPGDEFPVLFAGRGERKARCTRINRTGKPVIQTWDRTNERWGKERPMTVQDMLSEAQAYLARTGRPIR